MSEAEQAAVRGLKAYLQLLVDLATASAAGYQAFADQVTPQNVFRLDAGSGLTQAAFNSLNKTAEMVPPAYARFWKAL